MLACRYEMKYLISDVQTEAIRQYISPYISLDRYSRLQPEGYYPIVSLYLDSPNLQLCRESLSGKKNRFKLRIRCYSEDKQYPAFFEIKRRINSIIMKSRARVRHQDIKTLLRGHTLPKQDFRTNMDILNQFQLYICSIHAGPIVLIRYLRKAYEGGAYNRVRITFDRKLCYKVTHTPEVTLNGAGWQHNLLTMKGTILEIKYTGRYPAWLNGLASSFGLQQRSISKYATSIEQACALGFCAPMSG